jgi:hypothetical protein
MPEEEPVSGHRWNQRVNAFLAALGWCQVGDSNVDIVCSQCNRKHGLDSVFLYELPGQTPQMVFIEAKEREWRSAYKAEIERWCVDLLDKIGHIPYSPDFVRKFPAVPSAVSYNTGLLALWISDEVNFDPDRLAQRLKAVKLPEYRKNPRRIFVLSNKKILYLCAIVEELRRLRAATDDFREVSFYLPFYGRFSSTATQILPLEYIYSKVIFATAEKRYEGKIGTGWHTIEVVFYTGAVDYDSLTFLELALRRFQTGANKRDLHLYLTEATDADRSAIAQFQRGLESYVSGDLNIERLTLPATLPGWLSYEG